MSHNVTIFVTLSTLPIKLQWFQGVTSRRLLSVSRLPGCGCLGFALESIIPGNAPSSEALLSWRIWMTGARV